MKENFPGDVKCFDNTSGTLSHNQLISNIIDNDLKGFMVISNLEIEEYDHNPAFGFCVQKTELKKEWIENIKKENPNFHSNNSKILIAANKFFKSTILHSS